MTKIELENGKYTVTHNNGVGLRATRYGVPWRDLVGDGLVLAMAHRIEELAANAERWAGFRKAVCTQDEAFMARMEDLTPDHSVIPTEAEFDAMIDAAMCPELEQCRFCGIKAESVCDSPPAGICERAANATYGDPCKPSRTSVPDAKIAFEQAAYAHYLERHAAGQTEDQCEPVSTPESLFWKQDDGSYGVRMFNAAWWGWQAAKGLP